MATNPQYDQTGQSSAPPGYGQQQSNMYPGVQQAQYGSGQPQQQQYQQPQYQQPGQQYQQPQQQQYQQQQQPMMAQPVQYAQPMMQQQPMMMQQYQQQPMMMMQQPGTTIIMQGAPQAVYIPPTPFTTGPCDCAQDCCTFVTALFFPCAVIGQNEEMKTGATGSGCCCTTCLACGMFLLSGCFWPIWPAYLAQQRTATRLHMSIAGDSCEDFMCHLCCSPCALTQENIEIRKRKAQLIAQQQQQQPITHVMTY
jgi:Cys-rich protein (TIGR01571 family)